jgi:hypothetical protein
MLMVVETEPQSKLVGVLADAAASAAATAPAASVASSAIDEPAHAVQVDHEHAWRAQVCHQLGETLHCSQDSSISRWTADLHERRLREHCGPYSR